MNDDPKQLTADGGRLTAKTRHMPSSSAVGRRTIAVSDRRRRGVVVIYASVFMVAIIAVVSLAVDWGRVQTAKTELQDGTDAAARYAAAGLFDGTHVAKAQAAALQNTVDGSTLSIAAADVNVGYWNVAARTFTAGGSPTNAVRVIGRRTSALGNAVPLVFGRVIGANSADVTATSIARQSSVAIASNTTIILTGTAAVQRKSGEPGYVSVAANGVITTNPSTTVGGDILYRVAAATTGTVSGKAYALPSDFTYALPTVPGGATTYPGAYLTSGSTPVSGNIYLTADLYVGGTANLTLYGDTAIYCAANATFTGSMSVTTNGYRMFVYSVGSGIINYSNANPLPAVIYAPNSPVVLANTGALTGSVVGKSVTLSGTLNYNAVSGIPFKPTGGGEMMSAGGVIQMK